ncbi:MAG: hypothetical protein M1826_003699 [Phylliscum demangeonii]|nr:MAG: hypothetical protein M1826_003699 [Phylliscum demangeonii]
MRVLASLISLAMLRRALSTGSGPDSGSPRADPRDYREYLGHEGTFTDSLTEIVRPFLQNRVEECVAKGTRAGVAMKRPFTSDWARWLEFEAFLRCFARYMIIKTPYSRNPIPDNAPPHVQLQYTEAVSRAIEACNGELPATTVHRPTFLGREGAPPPTDASPGGAEHGASGPLQYRHPAASRPAALLHPWAWIRRLGPGLLREMRPAVRRAGAALENGGRAIEYLE